MKGITFSFATLAVAALLGAACTVHQTEAPSLTGPSEAALSLSITASPDSISQDGRSTSTIGLQARDASGRALSNLPFRLDMRVDGVAVDYGTLSSRNLTTGSDGRASAVYTAPPAPAVGASAGSCSGGSAAVTVAGRCVQIVATAVGTDYSASSSRMVEVHLVPVGVITPAASTPVANFTIAPSAPKASEAVVFDASKSCAGALDASGNCPASAGSIVSYEWSFGDGKTGSGRGISHSYALESNYLVTLTVTNDRGASASSSQSITIGAGVLPTPAFTYSPSAPSPGQSIFFDANTSKPGLGHRLTRFVFNWGDGSAFSDSSQPWANHSYASAGTYTVTLSVGDEAGQTASLSQTIAVGLGTAPSAAFTYSPTSVTPGLTVNFDATTSKANPGRSISQYQWNWGDGSALTTGASPVASHSFASAGTFVVRLTVTDDVGQTGVANNTVTVTQVVAAPPTAAYVFSPTAPAVAQSVNFDASLSKAGAGHSLVQYKWNFGDGSALVTSASPVASHSFATAGSFTVVLTVTDEVGQVNTVSQAVTVAAVSSDLPKPIFSKSSPDPVVPGQQVFFDASQSTVATGHTISGYLWSWGDGTTSTGGPITSHVYSAAGKYQVILSVTDNTGLTGVSAAQEVTVSAGPTAVFISSPGQGTVGLPMHFDASQSSGSGGITNYNWNWGDGTQSPAGTALMDHTYAAAGTYTVLLTVTDGAGHTGTVSHNVTIN